MFNNKIDSDIENKKILYIINENFFFNKFTSYCEKL